MQCRQSDDIMFTHSEGKAPEEYLEKQKYLIDFSGFSILVDIALIFKRLVFCMAWFSEIYRVEIAVVNQKCSNMLRIYFWINDKLK